MSSRLIWVLSTAIIACGCNYDATLRESAEEVNPISLSPGSELTFQTVFNYSIRPACLECHASPRNAGGLNLETYETVYANRTSISTALSTRFMPDSRGRTMTDTQRDLVLRWIQAGAPHTPPTNISSMEVIYE